MQEPVQASETVFEPEQTAGPTPETPQQPTAELTPASMSTSPLAIPNRRGDDGLAWLGLAAFMCVGALIVAMAAPLGGGLAQGTRWTEALEWRPGIGASQAWRWWTAAWVHWSVAHLAVNLLGAVVVGFVGWRARMPRAAACAWCLAWPLTQLLLGLPEPATVAETLRHYGGLSGVLHAGVIVLGLTLLGTHAGTEGRGPAAPRLDAPTTQHTIAPSRTTEGPWAMTSLEEVSAWQQLDEPPPAGGLEPLDPVQAGRHRMIGVALLAGTLAKVLLEAPWDLALRPNALLGIQVAPLAHACGILAGLLAWAGVALAVRAGPARHDTR